MAGLKTDIHGYIIGYGIKGLSQFFNENFFRFGDIIQVSIITIALLASVCNLESLKFPMPTPRQVRVYPALVLQCDQFIQGLSDFFSPTLKSPSVARSPGCCPLDESALSQLVGRPDRRLTRGIAGCGQFFMDVSILSLSAP